MSHYLNEFVFRFNRRRSRNRGMLFYRVLELAVIHEPLRYQELIARRRSKKVPPVPPQAAWPFPQPGAPGGEEAVAVS